ncbi:VOC family protein [Pelagerythrobacter aerophilus]
MEQTRPAFYKIFVADLDRAIDFYCECLGFTEQRRIDAGAFDEVILAPSKAGTALVLCRWKDGRNLTLGQANGPVGFYIAELDKTCETMIAHGATVRLEPTTFAGTQIAVLADPDGHQIELIQRQN